MTPLAMRRIATGIIAAGLVLPTLLALYLWYDSTTSSRHSAVMLRGKAEIWQSGAADWQTVSSASPVAGDAIRAVGNVTVALPDGTRLEMQPGAEIVIKQVAPDGAAVIVEQQAGRVTVESNNPLFRLETPSSAFALDVTRFRVDVAAAGDTAVTVEQGLVVSQSDGDSVLLAAGESLRTGTGQRAKAEASAPVVLLPPPPPPLPRTPTPTPTAVPPTPEPERFHVIVRGDTLSEIAQKYGVDLDDLVKLNNIKNPNSVPVGTRLIIPEPDK